MVISTFFSNARRCCCPKAVSLDGKGGYTINPSIRVGHNDKCPVHPNPPLVDEDEFAFETPLNPPSATS